MTRRYTNFASLYLVAATLTACDAAPESMPSASSDGAEAQPQPEADIDTPEAEGDDEVDVDCEPAPVVRPRVMFVLDKSSSMTNSGLETGEPAEDGGLSRWAQLHALVGALADGMESEVLTGAVLFPSTYAEAVREAVCDVRSVPEAAVGPYRAADLMDRLPSADAANFLGGSPAQAAYATALDHLDSLGGSAPTAIVLITDGGLNCVDEESPLGMVDDGLAELVGFARDSLQIQTFVIGVGVAPGEQKVPHGDPDAALREIALAGGAAHGDRGYFTIAEAQPLSQALDTFVGRAGADTNTTACP
jgi:hypothetical protein